MTLTRKLTVAELQRTLDTLDAGVLKTGAHTDEDGAFCVLEVVNKTRRPNDACTDARFGLPDIRPLNDAPWSSDVARTGPMLAVAAALSDFPQWSAQRQQRFAEHLTIAIVRQIIADLPGLPDVMRQRCREVSTVHEAGAAARAAAWAAAGAAARAAWAAAEAAAPNTVDSLLIHACEIFIDAATASDSDEG